MPSNTDKPRGVVRRTYTLDVEGKALTYRIVAVGDLSVGYDDTLLLQRLEHDEVGDQRWVTEVQARTEAPPGAVHVGRDALLALLRLLVSGQTYDRAAEIKPASPPVSPRGPRPDQW